MKTYGRLYREGPAWVIDAAPHVHLRAKRVFGRLETRKLGKLALTHGAETCRDLEWFLDRFPLAVSPEDAAVLRAGAAEHRDQIARVEQLIDPHYTPAEFRLALPLRSYQAREAEMYLATGGLLIADDVGLGKTASAIASYTDPRTLPAAVVTLAHLTRQWEEEIRKFAPDLMVHVVRRGTPYELPKWFGRGPDVLVLNYHKLAGWEKVIAAYARSIVYDEVQELRRAESAKHQVARGLAEVLQFRLGLSATPIYNYGGEIFNVLDVLRPGCLGNLGEFTREWCHGYGRTAQARIKDPKAFGAWCREQGLIIRHTRQQVSRELPEVIRVTHLVDSDPQALDRVQADAAELARLILSSAQLERGQRLQASEQLSVLLRQATGVAKAPYVADFVRLLVESGEKVVLFGWHREVYSIWLSKLADLKPVLYTGSESPAHKEVSRRAFLAGETPVFIMSLRSGAGLNGLQEVSSVAVFGELDWSPGVHEQCVGRLQRDGQTGKVCTYFLVAETGADPVIAETLGLKREQVQGIRDPDLDVVERLQVDEDRAARLARFYLASKGERVNGIPAGSTAGITPTARP